MGRPEKKDKKQQVKPPAKKTQVAKPQSAESKINSSEKSQKAKIQTALKSSGQKSSTSDRKLSAASESRRKTGNQGRSKSVSEKTRQFEGQIRSGKKSILREHLQEKAQQREKLVEQKASLQSEIKAMNKIAEVRETIDTQYTAKYSCWQSPISVVGKGAASTGLRKLDPSIAINMARAQAGAALKAKLEPKVQAQVAKLVTIARDLKVTNTKTLKEPVAIKTAPVAKEQDTLNRKIVNSKLRQKLKDMKEREIMRDPNRDPGKFEEVNFPPRGFGGLGGM